MKRTLRSVCLFLLVASIVLCNFVQVSAVGGKEVTLSFDKNDANVGEIITATVSVDNITGFDGLQFHMNYDPEVFQAVDPVTGVPYPALINNFPFDTNALRSDLLLNSQYMPIEWASFDSVNGTIDAMRMYMYWRQYYAGGIDEPSGVVARVGLKVLKKQETTVYMQNTPAMPSGIDGTLVACWDGTMVTDYQVQQVGNVIMQGY